MNELDVRIIQLEPMHVVSFLGFGKSPEEEAWKQLFDWARPKGLTENLEKHRLFGFNNPNPSPGSPNYGYEVWMVIDPEETDVEPSVKVKKFEGGLYAVTRCPVPLGQFGVIGQTWKKLATWREDSKYKCGNHQWLEESLSENLLDTEFVLDLYIPISE